MSFTPVADVELDWDFKPSGVWDCFEDMSVCWRTTFCFCIVAAEIAKVSGDKEWEGHELRSSCYSYAATVAFPISFCCCMRDMLPWKVSQWMDELYYKRWEYTKYPEPFGDMKVCNAYLNVEQPLFFWPIVMQLAREVKLREPNYNELALGPKLSDATRLKHMAKTGLLRRMGSTSFFLSHCWAADAEGRDNHKRVVKLGRALQERGYKVFLDEDDMTAQIKSTMAEGIQNSRVFLVFLTKEYIKKATADIANNCRYEWRAAQNMNKPFYPVVMERALQNPQYWGSLSAEMGGLLYADYCNDDDSAFNACVERILKENVIHLTPTAVPLSVSKAFDQTLL